MDRTRVIKTTLYICPLISDIFPVRNHPSVASLVILPRGIMVPKVKETARSDATAVPTESRPQLFPVPTNIAISSLAHPPSTQYNETPESKPLAYLHVALAALPSFWFASSLSGPGCVTWI